MRLIDAEQRILSMQQPVIQTRDVATLFNIPDPQASNILKRLAKAGRFVQLMRGKWATTTKLDPLSLPEYLTAPFPSYISLQTALFYHGMISQIPQTIFAVSLARTRQYPTPFGRISIHHLQTDFFFGFDMINQIKMATPEKALIDTLYLRPARSLSFKTLPEIEIPKKFQYKTAQAIINKISSPRIKSMVQARFDNIIQNSE